jgi:hypothetical protein
MNLYIGQARKNLNEGSGRYPSYLSQTQEPYIHFVRGLS